MVEAELPLKIWVCKVKEESARSGILYVSVEHVGCVQNMFYLEHSEFVVLNDRLNRLESNED